MAVPPEVRALLQEQVMAHTTTSEERVQRLVDLVFHPSQVGSIAEPGLEYDLGATLTVADTWRERRANCLSFTLLFVALAREIGLEAQMQEVGQVAIWYEDQGLIFNAGHVNVGMTIRGRKATLDLDSNVLYDRSGPKAISDQRAIAHFYNNRGAQRLGEHDYAGARAYFEAALRMDPKFVLSWNNLGVLEARVGNPLIAARDLETALAINDHHLPALQNAAALYQSMGDTARVARMQARLERVRRRDPFFQFMQGNIAERNGDYTQAVRYYKEAVRLYGSAHQFHFGLARAYFLAGDDRLAEREMTLARNLGGTDAWRSTYQGKLDAIRRLQHQHAVR